MWECAKGKGGGGGGGVPIFSCQKLNVQTNGGKLNESVAYIFICA